MIPVLVSAEAEPFLRNMDVPADLDVRILAPGDEVPPGDYAGILTLLTRRIGPEQLDRLPELRVVANMAVGYDNVDVEAARERGVWVTNTPDVLTGATAELTWALILAVARRVGEGERLVRSGGWEGWEPTQLMGSALDGKTLGIVGAGRIGREVGRRAGTFGMRVAYWGRTRRDAWEREVGAEWMGELSGLAAAADVLSIHLASTERTRRLIDGTILDAMKQGAILVNTARGDIVDEPALIERLEAGRIRAGLDVYADEPFVPERLRSLPNVVLLPHLGSATRETRQAMFELAWDNLVRCVRGGEAVSRVSGFGDRASGIGDRGSGIGEDEVSSREAGPPLGGIHEAALYVDDLGTAEAFWRRLGLEFVGRAEGRHVFFRAGRDMLLLFDAAATRQGGDVPAHGAEGPGHVALDVPDAEALDRWRAQLGRAGVGIEHEHEWPGGGRSLYFRDPAGNSLELITRGSWGL